MTQFTIAWDGKTLSSIGAEPMIFVPAEDDAWQGFGVNIIAVAVSKSTAVEIEDLETIFSLLKDRKLKTEEPIGFQPTLKLEESIYLLLIDENHKLWEWGYDTLKQCFMLLSRKHESRRVIGEEHELAWKMLNAGASSREAVVKAAESYKGSGALIGGNRFEVQTVSFENDKVSVNFDSIFIR